MDPFRSDHPFDLAFSADSKPIRLAHAALLLAEDTFVDVSVTDYLSRLDNIVERVDRSVECASDRIETLRHAIVEEEGLQGNFEDYQNPENLFLNRVIDTKRGVPVTLGAIWIDVANALGWPLFGIDMPGHFLLRYVDDTTDALIDPFNNGNGVSRALCGRMASELFGTEFQLTPQHFEPLNHRALLVRLLGNIYATDVQREDWARAVWALRRLNALSPDEPAILAELGRLETKNGDLDSALQTLNRALQLGQGTEHVSSINHHLFEVRRLINERN